MVGPADGVIGGDRDASLRKFLTQMPGRLPVAGGAARLDGAVITIDASSGRALTIARVNLTEGV